MVYAFFAVKYSTWEDCLYVPTMIQKVNDDYFIVDCWNHRILYNDSLDKDLSSWSMLTDENYRGGRTVASDGRILVCDNTDRSEILVYQKSGDGYSQIQVIEGALGRPHYVLYDEEHDCFYAIVSMLGKLYEYQDKTNRIEVERAFSLSKRYYGMGLITTKLYDTTLTSIALSVFVMNRFKIQSRILFTFLWLMELLTHQSADFEPKTV